MLDIGRPIFVITVDWADPPGGFGKCLRTEGFKLADFECVEDSPVSCGCRPRDAGVTDLAVLGTSDGELVPRLRRQPDLATVPIFALSLHARESRVSALFVCTLTRPVDLECVTGELKRALIFRAESES